jgi:hypothetical protein
LVVLGVSGVWLLSRLVCMSSLSFLVRLVGRVFSLGLVVVLWLPLSSWCFRLVAGVVEVVFGLLVW